MMTSVKPHLKPNQIKDLKEIELNNNVMIHHFIHLHALFWICWQKIEAL